MTTDFDMNTPPVKSKGTKTEPKVVSTIFLGPVPAEPSEMKVSKKSGMVELKLNIKDLPISDADGNDMKSTFGTVLEDGTITDSTAGVLAYLIANDIPIILNAQTAKLLEDE